MGARLWIAMAVGIATVAGVQGLSGSGAPPQNLQVPNGDFEQVSAGRLVGWQGDGQPVTTRHDWQRFEVKLRTRDYAVVRLYLRLQRAVGKIWFDDVSMEGVGLGNGSFEEHEGHRLAGWQQDDVGKTIFVDEAVARSGKCSLRIERSTPGQSRVWQDIRVKPKSTYKLVFWARWSGISGGRGYAEFYGVRADGSLGSILATSEAVSGSFRAWKNTVCALVSSRPADKIAWREVSLPPQATLLLTCKVDASGLEKGEAGVQVMAGGQMLGRASAEADGGKRELGVVFATPASGKVKVELFAKGVVGRVEFDDVLVQRLPLTPPPQRVTWRPASENMPLDKGVRIVLQPDASEQMKTAAKMLTRQISANGGVVDGVAYGDEPAKGRAIYLGTRQAAELLKKMGVSVPKVKEGYGLAVTRSVAAVMGSDDRGTFYGTMTLLNLIAKVTSGPQLVAAVIEDWPDLPFRGTYGVYGGDIQVAAETCARLKLNAMVIESGDFYRLDDQAKRKKWQQWAEVLRRHYIELIPEIQSFGHGGQVLSINPNCAEGVWVKGEEHVLRGERPSKLKHPNVIVTKAAPIVVSSPDGKIRYVEGKDYRIIPAPTRPPYRSREQWQIVRVAGGRIPDGGRVTVSYNYVRPGTMAYCPNEPLVYEIMRKAVTETVRLLRPRYLHIGHDEIYRMGTDSRCVKAGRSNAENLAMEMKRLLEFARQVDPKVQIMLWADMLNPYHNGKRFFPGNYTAGAADLIPKDAFIMNVWFYGANDPRGRGWQSLKWFAERGLRTTGSPWYNHRCAYEWANLCFYARSRGMPCMGVLYTSWRGRWDALATLAGYAWHHAVDWQPPKEKAGEG